MSDQLSFLDEYPAGIYRAQLLCVLDGGVLEPRDRRRLEAGLSSAHALPGYGYIETPQEFFRVWLNGRIGRRPVLDDICPGFELQFPCIEMRAIGEDVYGEIKGVAIASDFGYSGDFGDSLVFAINDARSQRALVYRDPGCRTLRQDPLGRKALAEQGIYGFGGGSERYPFDSINPLKSGNYTWTLVNIPRDDVYIALQEMGFEW